MYSQVASTSSISMLTSVLVILVISVCVHLYLKSRQVHKYWSSQGVAGPTPLPIVGNFHEFIRKPLIELFPDWYEQFGPMYGIYEGFKPILMIQDAQLIKELFIKNSHIFLDRRELPFADEYAASSLFAKRADEWRIHRKIMSPTFTSGKMKAMFSLMNECYDKLDAELIRVVERGVEVDAKYLFSKLTSSVIARCAFATEVDPYTNEDNKLLKSLHSMFKINKVRFILATLLPKKYRNHIRITGDAEGREFIREVCKEIVRERKMMKQSSQSVDSNYADLLQLLLDAGEKEKEETEVVADHESHHVIEGELNDTDYKFQGKKSFTEVEMIANVILFFSAGFETTSTLLQYCSFVLTNEPFIQEALYDELKRVYDENGGKFDYESVSSNALLDSFICETLRLYSPAGRLERTANASYTLPNGVKVSPGDLVTVSIHTLHRDPKYFEKANSFDLHRFLPENRGKIVPCSYLPFGLGPRNCIGMRFSLLEAKLALANFLIKYKFVSSPRTTSLLIFKPMTIVLTPKELQVKIELRD